MFVCVVCVHLDFQSHRFVCVVYFGPFVIYSFADFIPFLFIVLTESVHSDAFVWLTAVTRSPSVNRIVEIREVRGTNLYDTNRSEDG